MKIERFLNTRREPFINDQGQKIKPGQSVLAITERDNHQYVFEVVTYLGLSENNNVQVIRDACKFNRFLKCYEDVEILTTLKRNRIYKLRGIK